MTILVSSLLLIVSFYGLHKVTDKYFVLSLTEISSRLKITSDIAGATFMAMGSSAPELFISLLALVKGTHLSNLGVGTIVGSAIFNILVIIGASAIVRNTVLTWQPVIRDFTFYSISIILLYWVLRDGLVELDESLYFVLFYFVYLVSLPIWRKIFPYQDQDSAPVPEKKKKNNKAKSLAVKPLKLLKPIDIIMARIFPDLEKKPHFFMLVFIESIVFITFLSWILVEAGVELAQTLGMSYFLIGVTVLAVGTSIPDLMSSVIVARQGKGNMAVSNAVGSNIFDILVGLGVVWLVMIAVRGDAIPINQEKLNISILLLLGSVGVILAILIYRRWRIDSAFGVVLIFLYILYLIAIIIGWF